MTPTPAPAAADEFHSRVRAALRDQFGPGVDRLGDDDALSEALDGEYDSLAALECISRMETMFDIEVDFVADDVRHWFATPGRIAEFVRSRVEDRAALGGKP